MITGEHTTHLNSLFEAFYEEVARSKVEALEELPASATVPGAGLEGGPEAAGAPPPPESQPPSIRIRQRLLERLRQQSTSINHLGGELSQMYREAQYAMAALADEVFLHLPWHGREAWKQQMLEAAVFRSHRAGEVIFERIDALLANPTPARQDMMRIYLQMLGLGFQGKYRNRPEGQAELMAYRRQLFQAIHQREPELVAGTRQLFPQAYQHIFDRGKPQFLPYVRPWFIALLLVLLVWVAISFPIWNWLTSGLEEHFIQQTTSDSTGEIP